MNHATINRNVYGTRETSGLVDARSYHASFSGHDRPQVCWTTPGLRITRFRLVSDPGFPLWDVSYCHGVLAGQDVRVGLPFSQLPKRGMMAAIVEHAKRENVFAKRLGIFDALSTCN